MVRMTTFEILFIFTKIKEYKNKGKEGFFLLLEANRLNVLSAKTENKLKLVADG
jgi:citrate lyase synthetase